MAVDNTEYISYTGSGNFMSCSSLIAFDFPTETSVKTTGYEMLSGAVSLTKVTIPENITSISGSVFSGCWALDNVTLPSKLIEIGGNAFAT